MITERMTFRAKYGQGDDLVALMKDSFSIMPTSDLLGARLATDLTGQMFTCAIEMDFADLDTWAKSTQRDMEEYGSTAFQEWFAKMVACTEFGERQLLNVEKLR